MNFGSNAKEVHSHSCGISSVGVDSGRAQEMRADGLGALQCRRGQRSGLEDAESMAELPAAVGSLPDSLENRLPDLHTDTVSLSENI